MMHDVIVVGGGPVGCYTASLLAKKGFDVLVLEENPSLGHRRVCTGLIGVEAFDRFHLPRGSVINRIQDVTFISPSGICFSYRAVSPRAFVVNRQQFDRDIAEMAAGHGAELRCDSPARDIRIRKDGVTVAVEKPGGRISLEARMVVVASGFNPELTESLGLGSPGECLQGSQAELDVEGVEETEVYVGREIAPGSFAWVVPISPDKARIGMTTRGNAGLLLHGFLNNPMIRNRLTSRKPEINVDLIPIRPIGKSFTERVLVVGEAAGQVKATTGGGIYYGLISAEHAAETVGQAFSQARFDDEILKRYEKKWRDELSGELDIGYRFRQIFSGIKDEEIDGLFKTLHSNGISALIHRSARFDWHKELILVLSSQVIFRKHLRPLSLLTKRFIERRFIGT